MSRAFFNERDEIEMRHGAMRANPFLTDLIETHGAVAVEAAAPACLGYPANLVTTGDESRELRYYLSTQAS